MNIQSAINREIFAPLDQKLLVAIEVRRRNRKKASFLTAGRQKKYATFICLSASNKAPPQLFITKVKQFEGSPRFTKRSQWTAEQLRQVNGINPDKDSPEFDLTFDRSCDQWVAGSAAEKCMFIQVLFHACRHYWEGKAGQTNPGQPGEQPASGSQEGRKAPVVPRHPDFVNCQSKLMADACSVNMVIYRCKIFLSRMKNSMMSPRGRPRCEGKQASVKTRTPSPARGGMTKAVRRASQVLVERGDFPGRAEVKHAHMADSGRRHAGAARKVRTRTA
ncbi:syntaxin binding protein 6 (amisyn), like [Denticeps clupeoides]|uniref:Exocyst complex component Sec3 PIP2-binding N-terminal domain-containing protein n=1 Tax=Denticeps clupeoides TaxID=299321 RepID=A0AAY4CRD7_9TELE|nr:syntaxin-binding protein 6-like [Denticeps clupeoides]